MVKDLRQDDEAVYDRKLKNMAEEMLLVIGIFDANPNVGEWIKRHGKCIADKYGVDIADLKSEHFNHRINF